MENSAPQTQPLPPSETHPLTTPPASLQSSAPSKWLVPVLALLIPIAAVVGYYFGQQSVLVSSTGQVAQASPSPTTVASPIASPQPSPTAKAYVKRLFDPAQKWFLTQEYPSSMVSIKDPELVGISCTENYLADENGKYAFYNKTTQKHEPLVDQKILDTLALIVKSSGKRVDSFIACDTEDGRTFYEHEEYIGGGGGGNVAYVAEIKNTTYQQIGQLPNQGAPYFSCAQPLMLTKTGQFYFPCGGGDGGFGASGIYRLDIAAKKFTEIAYCSSQATGDGTEKTECR